MPFKYIGLISVSPKRKGTIKSKGVQRFKRCGLPCLGKHRSPETM